MRGIKYAAAFGTILVFAGFFAIKAVIRPGTSRHGSPLKGSSKIILLLFGIGAMVSGIWIIFESLMSID